MPESEIYCTERNPVSGTVYIFMSACGAERWDLGVKKMSAEKFAEARLLRSVDALAAASEWTDNSPEEDADARDAVDFVDPLLTYSPNRWKLGEDDDEDDEDDEIAGSRYAGLERLTAR